MGHAPRRVEVQKTSRRKGVKIQGGCGVWTTMETQPNRKIGLFFQVGQKSVRNNEPTKSATTNGTMELDGNGVSDRELKMKRDSRIEKKEHQRKWKEEMREKREKRKKSKGAGRSGKKKRKKERIKKKKNL